MSLQNPLCVGIDFTFKKAAYSGFVNGAVLRMFPKLKISIF
ncbi:Uncharacterised protein [Escherichia coli]|nr:Uncharacterised protein [Escherichia coli]SQL85101.1 Uncharacterised protein [Escherichia coli]SQS25526.1 Uncharacterised protein [Escherichia coli]SQY56553.1 Uncharacterised protein [Escherichia coli]SQY99456.1 Uncharacterised protein [Escherichia coli]